MKFKVLLIAALALLVTRRGAFAADAVDGVKSMPMEE